MDTDALINSIINQALNDSMKEAFNPKTFSVSASPQVTADPGPMVQTTSQPQVVDVGTSASLQPTRRLSREEREQQGIEQYQTEKDDANKDLILKGLLGAGVVAGIGLLGRNQIKRGTDLARQYSNTVEKGVGYNNKEYLKTRPSFFDPRFWTGNLEDQTLKQEQRGRLKEIYSNPMKLAGAAAYRLGLDGATDGSRSYGWRYNHPLSVLSDGIKKTIDPMNSMGVADRHGVYFAAAMPALAVGGLAYDITNPAELFRPPGFKQPNPDPENPKESTDPAIDLFQRFAMGRSGRPLKYSEAKKDIPDLDIDRYKNYLNFTYRDKGPLGLGLIKYTDENLEGHPELRMMGYPINIPTLTTAALGALGARVATTSMEKNYRKEMSQKVKDLMDVKQDRKGYSYVTKPENLGEAPSVRVFVPDKNEIPNPSDPKVIADYTGGKSPQLQRKTLMGALGGVALGVTAGAFLGHYINNTIASSRNNPETLPTTKEYGIS
jgi:hypothetical protein